MEYHISSLNQLIEKLKGATKEEYKSIGAVIDIPLSEFLPFAHWSDDCYARNCIERAQNFELILLCWEPGQKTAVHCHGGEECWVYVIDGEIEELHYQFVDDELVKGKSVQLGAGGTSFMSDEMGYHSIENISNQRTLTLHLYMDPIDDCTVYDKHSETFEPRSLSYHSYSGILEDVEV